MGYFRDDKDNKSMTRLLVFIAAVLAYVICLSMVGALIWFAHTSTPEHTKELETTPIVTVITTLLAYAGLKKVFQKREENRL